MLSPTTLFLIALASKVAFAIALLVAFRFRRQAAIFRAVAENTNDGLILQAYDSKVLWANPAYCRLMGYDEEEITGAYPLEYALPVDERWSPEDARTFRYDPTSKEFSGLTRLRNARKNGEEFVNEFSLSVVGEIPARVEDLKVVMACRDVSLEVRRDAALYEARNALLERRAVDRVSGALSRDHLYEALSTAIKMREVLTVYKVDIVDFSKINTAFGHDAGDHVLRKVSDRLKATLGEDAQVARLGNDEFVVLKPGRQSLRDLIYHLRHLVDTMRVPMRLSSGTVACRTTIGVAFHPRYAKSPDDLLRQVSLACDRARDRPKRPYAIYGATMHATMVEESMIEADLPDALASGEITFHGQPVFEVSSETRVASIELLARWQHPTLGTIRPDRFIAIATHMGRMSGFDKLAANAAIQLIHRLDQRGLSDVSVAFNLSPSSLLSDDFVTWLTWEVDRQDIKPNRLIVEVLETTFFSNSPKTDKATGQIARLRGAGFRPYLDDFGVGFAGLSHLANVRVDGLKIDRSLVQDIHQTRAAQLIVSSIVRIADQLDMRVIAEGAESENEIACLTGLGCKRIQGYGLARPMPLEDLLNKFARQNVDAIRA